MKHFPNGTVSAYLNEHNEFRLEQHTLPVADPDHDRLERIREAVLLFTDEEPIPKTRNAYKAAANSVSRRVSWRNGGRKPFRRHDLS